MKFIVKRLRTLSELYGNQLQILLSAEERIAQLFLDMQGWVADDELRSAFRSQQEETDLQIPRIRDLVSANAEEPESIKCKVAIALAAEAEDMMADAADATVCDVALITAAQRVKHYEIAVYGTIRDFARLLGKHQDAEMLDAILREEKEADRLMTRIAERINAQAREHIPR